ncbi:hypothetical protein ACFVQB_17515 [Paenibacillus sp. NPDC057886]|uniref:hypothetical protein n=1 Tax=Paenibacillus sp. NPDC057886 TaxID=3346270 RepID=UPI0036B797E1
MDDETPKVKGFEGPRMLDEIWLRDMVFDVINNNGKQKKNLSDFTRFFDIVYK